MPRKVVSPTTTLVSAFMRLEVHEAGMVLETLDAIYSERRKLAEGRATQRPAAGKVPKPHKPAAQTPPAPAVAAKPTRSPRPAPPPPAPTAQTPTPVDVDTD